MTTTMLLLVQIIALSISFRMRGVKSFQPLPILPSHVTYQTSSSSFVAVRSTPASSSYLVIPEERDDYYDGNTAQYLIDLHDKKATLNFCGGMMFQLVISDKLRDHLEGVASSTSEIAIATGEQQQQPFVFDASYPGMKQIPNYKQSSKVDNIQIFHGREIRQVPDATGGMNFVLQLSYNNDDPEGWTKEEKERYDGWGHDSSREWRKGDQLVKEGYTNFKTRFGPKAFSLHHRFYFHYDNGNRLWLSAEDGCEGFPASTPSSGLDGVVNRIAALMDF